MIQSFNILPSLKMPLYLLLIIIFTRDTASFISSNKLITAQENIKLVEVEDENCIITSFDQVSDVTFDCIYIIIRNLTVPAGKTLNLALNDFTEVHFDGVILFERIEDSWDGPLVSVSGTIITVIGNPGSVLDGQGPLYWGNKSNELRPTFFKIECFESRFYNVSLLNCPGKCVQIDNTITITLSGWNIDTSAGGPDVAPEGKEASNTTGFQIASGSNFIRLYNSTVKNQGNCIEVNFGDNMVFSDVICSGGEGLAVDVGNSFGNAVTNVHFENSTVTNSTHAVKVVTHTDAGSGFLLDIIYRNITISDISGYAVVAEQDYTNGVPTGIPSNDISVDRLSLINISGTLTADAPGSVYILCGEFCRNWSFMGLNITGTGANSNSSVCNYIPLGFDC